MIIIIINIINKIREGKPCTLINSLDPDVKYNIQNKNRNKFVLINRNNNLN